MIRAAILSLALLPVAARAEVISARYDGPTGRYDHGILGDAVEYGTLVLGLAEGTEVRHELPETRVFEDLAPRLWDLDGDGQPEVIVVETDLALGAQLAVYDAAGKRTATPFIGRSNRWLAPIGAADLDGDGRVEIAYIDRPHLAKVLRIWRYADGALSEVASAEGLTNHRIGWDHIPGGIRDCGQGPEIVTANAGWTRVMVSRLAGDQIETRAAGALDTLKRIDAALACEF